MLCKGEGEGGNGFVFLRLISSYEGDVELMFVGGGGRSEYVVGKRGGKRTTLFPSFFWRAEEEGGVDFFFYVPASFWRGCVYVVARGKGKGKMRSTFF